MRTFDDIIPPSRRHGEESTLITSNAKNRPVKDASHIPGSSRFPRGVFAVTLLVIIVSVGLLYYFSTAKVEVIPNTFSAAIQTALSAAPDSGDLTYQIVTSQKVATESVKGSGTKTVSIPASGTITIYNTQTKAQKLVANTRFATTAGLIFRTKAAVTIPAGSTAKPGSVTTKVYADKPGDAYNVDPTSFTAPGLAGTPQASQVYARSTSAMTGGASGTVPVVDTVVKQQAEQSLVNALAPQLQASAPEGYILIPGSATTTYEELSVTPSATAGMVDIQEQGTVTAVVFPTQALAKALALSVSGLNYQGEPLSFLPASTLTLRATTLPTDDTSSFSFTIAGTAAFEYTVDPTRIAAAIAGKTRSAAEVALSNYPEVKRAILTLRPFWRGSFPQDPSSIQVTVTHP